MVLQPQSARLHPGARASLRGASHQRGRGSAAAGAAGVVHPALGFCQLLQLPVRPGGPNAGARCCWLGIAGATDSGLPRERGCAVAAVGRLKRLARCAGGGDAEAGLLDGPVLLLWQLVPARARRRFLRILGGEALGPAQQRGARAQAPEQGRALAHRRGVWRGGQRAVFFSRPGGRHCRLRGRVRKKLETTRARDRLHARPHPYSRTRRLAAPGRVVAERPAFGGPGVAGARRQSQHLQTGLRKGVRKAVSRFGTHHRADATHHGRGPGARGRLPKRRRPLQSRLDVPPPRTRGPVGF